ncbi:GNAT family N-acetyltransferase [uncultured Cohaesibacter sp.]|uniref:GNAT family N-acetyltransferase n=1 Tax=uncultured Cohaesibacter sp. TaxID=1002546 RepID=UPI0029C7134D|nr:GNAT family N-acetyltransferase [uncultured Cohaesibacter sp.]
MSAPHPLRFTRLSRISVEELLSHMSDPRVAEHMPLMPESWALESIQDFVAAKEACWHRDSLGHWAFLWDGVYIGWGGFQLEAGEWDYGLVLRPEHFGKGMAITRQALAFAKSDERIDFVTFLLPPTRLRLGALKRLGARQVGSVTYDGQEFRKFRLETV